MRGISLIIADRFSNPMAKIDSLTFTDSDTSELTIADYSTTTLYAYVKFRASMYFNMYVAPSLIA